ncbi:MAG: hypothetical protein AAGN46_17795 [Acidobacteriota bacterium]
MTKFICEAFDFSATGVLCAFEEIFGTSGSSLSVFSRADNDRLDAVDTDLDFQTVVAALKRREYEAVQASVRDGPFGMVGSPRYAEMNYWNLWVEELSPEEIRRIWQGTLSSCVSVRVVICWFEDGHELIEDHLQSDGFPWDHWLLVEAAVRLGESSWDVRRGAQAALVSSTLFSEY